MFNTFIIYIILFLYFFLYDTKLYPQENIFYLKDYKIFLPQEYSIELKKDNLVFLKTIDNKIYSFVGKIEKGTFQNLSSSILDKISNSGLLTKNGFKILHKKQFNMNPKLKSVGCLENRFKNCLKVLNFYYKVEEILLEIVLEKSMATESLRNFIFYVIFNQNVPSSSNHNNKELFFRTYIQIIENQNKEYFIISSFIPKSNFPEYEFLIKQISPTNILSKDAQFYKYEEYFNLTENQKENYFLFVIDNSSSMKEEQKAIQKNMENFIKKLSLFGNNFSIGILTTDSCQLKTNFTNNIDQLVKNILVGTHGNDKESCVYYAEKFLLDPECNYNMVPENLSIICITDESDAYEIISNTTFNIKNNVFIEKKIPFYSIMPLNNIGEPGDCNAENGITDFTGNFRNLENTIKKSVNLKILAEKTNASISSICNEEYSTFLEEIAYSTSFKNSNIILSRIPISNSIEVWINNKKIKPYIREKSNPDEIYFIFSEEENSILIIGEFQNSKIRISYYSMDY